MTIFDTLLAELDRLQRPADCKLRLWTSQRKASFDAIPEGPAKDDVEDRLRAAMTKHEDWLPTWSGFAIEAVKDYSLERKARIQMIYARDLMKTDKPEIPFIINNLLQKENRTPGILAPRVAKVLHTWLQDKNYGLKGLSRKLQKEYNNS